MSIKVTPQKLSDVLLIEPAVYGDDRGFFKEQFHAGRYADAGLPGRYVQDNYSLSKPGVLRGMHLQLDQPQGKLISVLEGAVYDVAIDVRRGSATFGQWCGAILTAENHHQLYIPEGFAHGFAVLGDVPAGVLYKCTALYNPASEAGIHWNDPDVAIDWPVSNPILSPRDAELPLLKNATALPA